MLGIALVLSVLVIGFFSVAVDGPAASRPVSSTAPSQAAGIGRTSAENEAAARSEAPALLAGVPLPPGATPSPTDPTGMKAQLGFSTDAPATPNLVDDHSWWTVPGSPTEVLAYIRAHMPASARRTLYGEEEAAYEWPSIPGVLDLRQLAVTVAPLPNGSTGLRADAEVVWLLPRRAAEVVPSGAHLLRISVHRELGRNRPRGRPLSVSSPKKIEAIVARLNALPLVQPGVTGCPSDFGIRVDLSFYAARKAPPLAVADVDPDGCGPIRLTIRGQQQEPLQGGGWLITQIDHVLGVRIDVAPQLPRSRPGHQR
jgi:hypothetical protein